MKSKTVKLISGVVSLGVLCGAYVGVKSYVSEQEEKEAEGEEGEALVTLKASDVNSVKYTADDEDVSLTKEDDTWTRDEDSEFPLSQSEVNSAVNALLETDIYQEISDVEDLGDYDLDTPQNQITLATADGDEEVLEIGLENESTDKYYVKKSGDDTKVYVVDSSAIEPFMSSVYELAESGEFPTITSSTINKVEVDKEDGYTITEDTEDLSWEVSDGKTTEEATSSAASEVTSAISSLAYDEFVNYKCTDDSEYGFDDPYAVITVDYTEEEEVEADDEDADTEDTDSEDTADEEEASDDDSEDEEEEPETVTVDKQLVICIGDETNNDSRYVKVGDSDEVYTITDDSLTDILDKTVSDFYNLVVNYVSSSALDNLKIETADGTHTLSITREVTEEESDDDSDETTTTTTLTYFLDGEELDSSSFSTFYNKLVNLTAQERLAEDYEPEGDAAYTFTFTDTDGEETEVSYYEYDSSFYAAVIDGRVYLVNKMNVREMDTAYTEMLNSAGEADSEDTEE